MGVITFLWKSILWIAENWQKIGLVFLLIFVISLTGSLTVTIKSIKRGFKEMWNPIGIAVFLILTILIFILLDSFGVSLWG